MEKTIYLVRHCEATGQERVAELTDKGRIQAKELVTFFKGKKIGRIVSSPFTRAINTIKPLAKERNLPIQVDERLRERTLSNENLPDWMEKLAQTFEDEHLTFSGGESSFEATKRILAVINECDKQQNTVIVTHGNIMSLLIRYFKPSFGFHAWKTLTNPDVYELSIIGDDFVVKRIFNDGK